MTLTPPKWKQVPNKLSVPFITLRLFQQTYQATFTFTGYILKGFPIHSWRLPGIAW